MGEGSFGRGTYAPLSAARVYALVFGVAYLGVAILELFFPLDEPLTAGGAILLQRTTLHNVFHFAVGVAVLGAYFAGEAPARMAARITGVLFLALAIWGFAAPGSLGSFLGYPQAFPTAYNLIHAVTAVPALLAGFVATGDRRAAAA